jgi:hypothetical protein
MAPQEGRSAQRTAALENSCGIPDDRSVLARQQMGITPAAGKAIGQGGYEITGQKPTWFYGFKRLISNERMRRTWNG